MILITISFCQLLCDGDNYARLMANAQIEQWKVTCDQDHLSPGRYMYTAQRVTVLFLWGNSKQRATTHQLIRKPIVWCWGLSIFGTHRAITILWQSRNWLNAKPGANSWRTTLSPNVKSQVTLWKVWNILRQITLPVLVHWLGIGVIHEA